MMINIVRGEQPADTLRIWFETYHPEYPAEQLAFWEEQVVRDLCDPYTCVYNVVYFLDAQHNAYLIMHMELYGKWEPTTFPPPLKKPELPPIPIVWSPAPRTISCEMNALKERVDWIFAGGGRICFPEDPDLGTPTHSIFLF